MTNDTDRLPFFHRCPKCQSIMPYVGGTRFKTFVPDLMSCLICGWNNEQFFFFDAVKQQHIEIRREG